MDSMKELYLQIHDLHPFHSGHPSTASEGPFWQYSILLEKLNVAIHEAVQFQKNNPDWFDKRKVKKKIEPRVNNTEDRPESDTRVVPTKHRPLEHPIHTEFRPESDTRNVPSKHRPHEHTISRVMKENKSDVDIDNNPIDFETDTLFLRSFPQPPDDKSSHNATERPDSSFVYESLSMNRCDSAYFSGLTNKETEQFKFPSSSFIPPRPLDDGSSVSSVDVNNMMKTFNNDVSFTGSWRSRRRSEESIQDISEC